MAHLPRDSEPTASSGRAPAPTRAGQRPQSPRQPHGRRKRRTRADKEKRSALETTVTRGRSPSPGSHLGEEVPLPGWEPSRPGVIGGSRGWRAERLVADENILEKWFEVEKLTSRAWCVFFERSRPLARLWLLVIGFVASYRRGMPFDGCL